jgi:hypothetical protein
MSNNCVSTIFFKVGGKSCGETFYFAKLKIQLPLLRKIVYMYLIEKYEFLVRLLILERNEGSHIPCQTSNFVSSYN